MEKKTKIEAEEGKQDLFIIREFELPLHLLFKAYKDPRIIEQWMGTRVLKLENQKHGSWAFETRNPEGKVVFKANGAIHEFIPDTRIIRTFEMENAAFGVQLEHLEFTEVSESVSQLRIHTVYQSNAQRDLMLKYGMSAGINLAHNRLQTIVAPLI